MVTVPGAFFSAYSPERPTPEKCAEAHWLARLRDGAIDTGRAKAKGRLRHDLQQWIGSNLKFADERPVVRGDKQ